MVTDELFDLCADGHGSTRSEWVYRAPSDQAYGYDAILTEFEEIDLDDGLLDNPLFPSDGIHHWACDFNGDTDFNTLYCLKMNYGSPAVLYTVDLSSGAETMVGATGVSLHCGGMSWDPENDQMYIGCGDCGGATNIYPIDLGSGGAGAPVSLPSGYCLIGIAFDQCGTGYMHDIITDAIYSFDKDTGATTYLGPTGFNANYAQGMDIDLDDNTGYLFAFNGSTFYYELRIFDLTNGSTSYVGGEYYREIIGTGIDSPTGECEEEPPTGGGGDECDLTPVLEAIEDVKAEIVDIKAEITDLEVTCDTCEIVQYLTEPMLPGAPELPSTHPCYVMGKMGGARGR
jgi:hypothetical protein